MNVEVISAVLFVLVVAGFFVYWYINKPTEEQKKIINEFLESLYDSILEVIKNSIKKKTIDGENSTFYVDFDFFKDDVIKEVTEASWNFIMAAIDNTFEGEKALKVLAKKIITRENVETLINTIIAKENVEEMIAEQYNTNIAAIYEGMLEEDRLESEKMIAAENDEIGDENFIDEPEERRPYMEVEYPEESNISADDEAVEVIK